MKPAKAKLEEMMGGEASTKSFLLQLIKDHVNESAQINEQQRWSLMFDVYAGADEFDSLPPSPTVRDAFSKRFAREIATWLNTCHE